ncbi:hypothetical protein DNTS_003270 [Danionella cerebrum]|uniref:Uncharacterized protein n=1 Tax=Danionella cerebrum TaxID=2873325 RepID=A0A553MVH7_9TELE|nr:hypothetical protein DNTS_003270 [Danionella translucida]
MRCFVIQDVLYIWRALREDEDLKPEARTGLSSAGAEREEDPAARAAPPVFRLPVQEVAARGSSASVVPADTSTAGPDLVPLNLRSTGSRPLISRSSGSRPGHASPTERSVRNTAETEQSGGSLSLSVSLSLSLSKLDEHGSNHDEGSATLRLMKELIGLLTLRSHLGLGAALPVADVLGDDPLHLLSELGILGQLSHTSDTFEIEAQMLSAVFATGAWETATNHRIGAGLPALWIITMGFGQWN